jgi:UDPglucose--hexose-1-phosphate uridylyltransferase
MSVIRLKSENKNKITELSDRILSSWRSYSDEDVFIFSETDGEPHNTITPIASMADDKYIMDLVLRNNITTDEHPFGVYHPHTELHNIKKENIGLIEVMGLAVLPSRLVCEMDAVADALINNEDMSKNPKTEIHKKWAEEVKNNHPEINKDNVDDILKQEIGKTFVNVLEHAGVYKRDERGMNAFDKFINQI